MNKRKVIVFIACSTDGYIAGKEDNLDFLSIVEAPPEDYGYAAFVNTVDTVIMGRKTYEKVLSFGVPFPHQGRSCYVISTSRQGKDEHVTFWNDTPERLIEQLQKEEGGSIFVDGGAATIHALLKKELIDEFIISIIPHLLGSGIRLFADDFPEQSLKLTDSKTFPSGLVQLWYQKSSS
jgi:dihydrofolate reductase